MPRFKIFFGDAWDSADDAINEWLETHPDVEIVSFQHALAKYSNNTVHSICIMYKEN